MKKAFLFFASAILLFFGCEPFDELAYEPQVRSLSYNQEFLIEAFGGLTDGDPAACNIIYSPEQIPDRLCNIISDAEPGSEIVFLVDKTGSMADDIEEVKRNINRIIDCLPEGCRLGAAAYGDIFADGAAWYTSVDLDEDYEAARAFINAISVVGGGDPPESVFDALYELLENMSWKDCSAPDRIIVMGDAPPHTGGGTTYEAEDVLDKARSICPDTEFYPVIILDL